MKVSEYIPVLIFMLILPVYGVRSRCGGIMCRPVAEIPKMKWIKTPEIANPEDREILEAPAPLPAEPGYSEDGAESNENTPETAENDGKADKGAAEAKDDNEE